MLIDRIVDAATTRMITGMVKPVDGVLAVDMLIGPDLLQGLDPRRIRDKARWEACPCCWKSALVAARRQTRYPRGARSKTQLPAIDRIAGDHSHAAPRRTSTQSPPTLAAMPAAVASPTTRSSLGRLISTPCT